LIALDRQERGQGELSAIQEVERDFGITVASIVGLNQVLDYVSGNPELAQYADAIAAYRDQYGVK
ncbi:MAG: orotate phosphoribosyltransferase, partial [Thalassolituus sp.]|nr:orotate phosphoribosyltransferase [Thalassolituus sp.]